MGQVDHFEREGTPRCPFDTFCARFLPVRAASIYASQEHGCKCFVLLVLAIHMDGRERLETGRMERLTKCRLLACGYRGGWRRIGRGRGKDMKCNENDTMQCR